MTKPSSQISSSCSFVAVTTEAIPEKTALSDTAAEVVPEQPDHSDRAMKVIPELSTLPDMATNAVLEMPIPELSAPPWLIELPALPWSPELPTAPWRLPTLPAPPCLTARDLLYSFWRGVAPSGRGELCRMFCLCFWFCLLCSI